MPFWLAVVLGYFIVARGTRFVTSDYLAADFRAWVMRRFGDGKLYYLVTCAWCTGIWIALPVSVIVVLSFAPGWFTLWGAIFAIAGLWAAYSYVHGIITNNLDG